MKNKKYFYIVFLVIASILCSCHSPTKTYGEIETSKLSDNLRNSFVLKNKTKKYPKYYGGSYTTNDRLVILVVDDTTLRVRQDIIKRCQGTNITLFKCDKLSDATRKILHELYNFRNNPKNTQLIKYLRFKSCFLNSDQRVSIELLSFREDIFRKKIIDSPLLDFEETIIELH